MRLSRLSSPGLPMQGRSHRNLYFCILTLLPISLWMTWLPQLFSSNEFPWWPKACRKKLSGKGKSAGLGVLASRKTPSRMIGILPTGFLLGGRSRGKRNYRHGSGARWSCPLIPGDLCLDSRPICICHTQPHIYVCEHVCNIQKHEPIWIYVCMFIHKCACPYMHTYIQMYVSWETQIHKCMHKHTYTHTHTASSPLFTFSAK